MAKRYSIHQPNDADRRTALLGLALSGTSEPAGPCLSDQEMAALVDNTCSGKEREYYFQHLANCDSCYRHWLELSKIVANDNKMQDENSRPRIIRPQFFAWTGSLLAAAASVVIFLQITGKAPTPVVPRQSMETITGNRRGPARDQQAESTAVKSMAKSVKAYGGKGLDMAANEITSPAAVAPAPPVKKMAGHDTASYGQPQSTVKNQQQTLAGSIDGNSCNARTTGIRKSRSPGRVWLDKVKQGCRHNETSSQFWQQQFRTGKQLAMLQDSVEKQLIKELLPLVGKLQQKGNDGQDICEAILNQLEAVSLQ